MRSAIQIIHRRLFVIVLAFFLAGVSYAQQPITRMDAPTPMPPKMPPVVQEPAPPTDDRIQQFWERHGGMFLFGYPLAEVRYEVAPDGRRRLVQWFERVRLEIYDDVGHVQVAPLGLEIRGFIDDPVLRPDGCLYFDQTQQPLCEPFLSFWSNHGIEHDGRPGISYEESIALFGMPISTPTYEVNGRNSAGLFLTQWFEQARLEYHPQNVRTPYQVLSGRLGMELYSEFWGNPFNDVLPPEQAPGSPQPSAPPSTAPPGTTPPPAASSACTASAPAPMEGVQAWVTNATPAPGEEVTLCVRLVLNGQGAAGASATGLIQYDTTETQLGPQSTRHDGIAAMPFVVDAQAQGTVSIPVIVRYENTNRTSETSFTVP